ncbi:MAG: glycosyltransferase family 4 protein [Candidatus Micrarchaeia archaeon]
MKLLMLNPFYPPYQGGTEKHVYEVSRRLAKNHDVTVLTARLKGTKAEETVEGVRIVRTPAWVLNDLPHPLPPPVPVTPFSLLDLAREAKKVDLVHIHNRFVYGSADVTLVKRHLKKKLGITIHNARTVGIDAATDALGQFYDDVIGKSTMKACTCIAGVSRATIRETVPSELWPRTRVAYNGVDHDLFNPRVSGRKFREDNRIEGQMVLTTCRLVKQKGLSYLIDAMKGLDATLVVLGRGPLEKELKAQAKREGVNAVFCTGHVSDKYLAGIYGACDVFALPSVWEPFGMVLAEAMAAGKPVVGTDAGGIPEVIGDAGFVCKKASAKALKERIKTLLGDKNLRMRLGAKGRKRVLEKFTWDETARAYEEMYAELAV